jgi:hypothetical protein
MSVSKITSPATPLDVVNKINEVIDNQGGGGGGGTVDSALSHTSTNPVQNKVVTAALSDISATINIDAYLDLIIAGNTSNLPDVIQSSYETDLTDIIGGTYVNV